MADELDMHDDDHHNAGLGAGIEDGDLDQLRQMRMERGGKYAAIGRNIMRPVRSVKNAFRYAVKHPFKATGMAAVATTYGTVVSSIGAKILGQEVNVENVLSTGITTGINYPLAIGAANLFFYTKSRGEDFAAGADHVIGHKKVQKTGLWVGGAAATFMTLVGNMYGDNYLKTYLSPILDPLNTGAYAFAAIPDKIGDVVWSATEGTHLDTWVTPADTAACEVRALDNTTAFRLPCRDAYFDGSSFTPFDGYLNEVGNHDGLAGAWNAVRSGLESIGVMQPANDDGASLDRFLQAHPQQSFG